MKKGAGFTIIEVMIFLTITGALLLMAIIGSGGMSADLRFSDTVNTFHGFIQQQYEDVLNGVNTRSVGSACKPSASAGMDSCLLVGKVVAFDSGPVFAGTTRYVRANITTPIDATLSTYQQLSQMSTMIDVMSAAEQTFELQWGASVKEASRSTDRIGSDPVKTGSSPSRALINAVAYMRSPNSSQIVPYYFYAASTNASDVKVGLVNAMNILNVPKTVQTEAAICLTNYKDYNGGSRVAAVVFGGATGSSGITVNYEAKKGANEICS